MNSASVSHKTVLSRITEFFINNSVLYYLSCFLLLLGAYLMMHSPWLSGGLLTKYCEIYGIFLFYVVVLAGVCFVVFRRLAMAEDGLVVAGLVLLLVLDPAFFNNLFYTYSLRVGLIVNSCGFGLAVTLYVALKALLGIPWSKTAIATAVLATGFIYYYPLGLNIPQAEAMKNSYLYLLWWMPLVLAVLFDRLSDASSVSTEASGEQSKTVISHRLLKIFRVASTLIVFCMVLSHLLAANYAYSLDLYPEYLAPIFLGAGLLYFKLSPRVGNKGKKLLWACAVLALCCSCGTGQRSMIHFASGIVLSPFHYGFCVAALYLLYFWKTYRSRSWATAAAICMAFVVSGASFSDSLFNISHFHFVPFAVFAIVLLVSFIIERSWIIAAMAGACALISVLSLTPIQDTNKLLIFLQAGPTWFGVVHWYFYRSKHQGVYSIIGAFILLVPSLMWCTSPHRLAWGSDYFITVTSLFFAARFLGNSFLSTLAVFGVVGGALYLARNQLVSVAAEVRREINFGLLVTLLAFLILPIAFFLSVLKVRRRGQTDMRKQLLPEK